MTTLLGAIGGGALGWLLWRLWFPPSLKLRRDKLDEINAPSRP